MTEIYSPSNSKILFVKKLAEKRNRDDSGLFFAEGARNVLDILKAVPESEVDSIFVTEKFAKQPDLAAFDDKLILTNDICLQRMSDAKTSQGIIAVLRQPRYYTEPVDYSILLDGITDGGNLGTIIRTSAAAGYGVILKDCADIFSPKVVRSSMSAIVKTKIYKYDEALISRLKADGVIFFAGDMDGQSLFSLSIKPKKLCIAIGNEAAGLSDYVRKICTQKVSVPMRDMESLNASVSAAILMYNLKYR